MQLAGYKATWTLNCSHKQSRQEGFFYLVQHGIGVRRRTHTWKSLNDNSWDIYVSIPRNFIMIKFFNAYVMIAEGIYVCTLNIFYQNRSTSLNSLTLCLSSFLHFFLLFLSSAPSFTLSLSLSLFLFYILSFLSISRLLMYPLSLQLQYYLRGKGRIT